MAALTALAHATEVGCLVYAAGYCLAAWRYLGRVRQPASHPSSAVPTSVGVVYLCCNDFDEEALQSLSRLCSESRLVHVLQDDSDDPGQRARVDGAVARAALETGVRWRVLRRAVRSGGKPGALNHVLAATGAEYEFFLLADNDSIATNPSILDAALASCQAPGVAGVQMRNRAFVRSDATRFERSLSAAVDMFDAYMTGLYEPLWVPFVGHNALLRTRSVLAAGGFAPGVFADDIDLSVRMNLRGERIVYRRDLEMGERHPENYRAFCTRSRKWARGCGQILRMHLAAFLGAASLRTREKLGFLLFVGTYLAQVAIVPYVAIVFLLLPLLTGGGWSASWWTIFVGTLVPLTFFLPLLAYLATERRALGSPVRTLLATSATYGSTDLWTCAGIFEGLIPGSRDWVPTNSVQASGETWGDWAHFLVGIAVLVSSLLLAPVLLLFPLTWLLAAKYLFVPTVAAYYGGSARSSRRTTAATRLRPSSAAHLLLAFACAVGLATHSTGSDAQVGGDLGGATGLLVDGEPYLMKGIHYSPWRPGEGPGKGFDYPSAEDIRFDLDLVRAANANTIIAYDPSRELLRIADELELKVVYVFYLGWWRVAGGEVDALAAEVTRRVAEVREEPAVLAWMLGNEIPGWVIDEVGADGVRKALSTIRANIRDVDPVRPVCHGNWPLNRTLDLDRDMDLLCYNVYPFYPTEVAALGYGPFLAQEILPLANGRPVLITEFGVNTIEASPERQAQILRTCWTELVEVGCSGGAVFSFADEWWKNYDNPIEPPDWWRRAEAPDDHLRHDRDPEEHYGILRDDRTPKPAYGAVAAMFAEGHDSGRPRPASWGVLSPRIFGGLLVASAIGVALFLRHRGRSSATT